MSEIKIEINTFDWLNYFDSFNAYHHFYTLNNFLF